MPIIDPGPYYRVKPKSEAETSFRFRLNQAWPTTLEPSAASEAWCHQRGYICFIEELHRKKVKAGESFGAAYVVGWFDDIKEMEKVYDKHKGATTIEVTKDAFRLR